MECNKEIEVLQSTINSLGYLEDGKYYAEPDCFGMFLQFFISFISF